MVLAFELSYIAVCAFVPLNCITSSVETHLRDY